MGTGTWLDESANPVLLQYPRALVSVPVGQEHLFTLKLVAEINAHFVKETSHFYDLDGNLLTTLDGVVRAIENNSLQLK